MSSYIHSCPSVLPQTAYCILSGRRLLAVSGPDSTRYLQGAVTVNVPNEKRPTGFYSAFLIPQGRVLHDVFIYPFKEVEGRYKGEEGWLIEVDADEIENLAKRIRRYRLSSKFEVRILPETERRVWSVWGNEDKNNLRNIPSLDSYTNKTHAVGDIACLDNRATGMGYRLLLTGNKKPELEMEECHEDCYRLRRYLRGVPEGQREILKEHALPQESNIDFMGGIDFRKGCYVGQELTIRTHHRGVVRKRILPLQIYRADEKEPSEISFQSRSRLDAENIPVNSIIDRWDEKGRGAGKWLAGMGNLGLGLCRIAEITKTVAEDNTESLKAEDEFKIEWEDVESKKMVKVKAFIPDWHAEKI
ncbi:putative transferase CAF17, mitochondrial [Golovinomyces cichoracearum]|uniref:Iron-sulfur cluster assembly factor IBA57 homolog, mitochondrial n=1 Tax=Golovinomyces cichoracearum TaxID=62708 RepID=A0A420J7W9_9PEZI|nr:putative transferase CAF17, mitochondrial [Golovinomyces cichoracearum]